MPSGSLNVGNGTYSASGDDRFDIRNAPVFGVIDLMEVRDASNVAMSVSGQKPSEFSLMRIVDTNQGIINSVSIPNPLPALGTFQTTDFRLVFSGSGQVFGSINSV